jgi:PAS domain S-box-containing protein
MKEHVRRPGYTYLVAVGATAAVVLLRWLLDPALSNYLPLGTLYGSVVLAVWYGGYRPALLAAVLNCLASYWLFPESDDIAGFIDVRSPLGMIRYAVSCGIIIGFAELLRTARDRAEQQREWLQVMLGSIGDGVITTDAQGRVVTLNPVAAAVTGWTQEEAAGRSFEEVFPIFNEQTRKPVENPIKLVLAKGHIVGLANHTILIARDGTERPIDDSAAPIRDAERGIIGVVLIFRDVTERRRAEKIARALAAIVESSDDAIIGKDINGVITSWNHGAERIFGYTAPEAIGRPIAMLAPPARADEMPELLERIRRGERVDHFDTLRRAKHGELVPISLTVSPIKDKDGQIIGASKIARDISERKQAEEALYEEKARLHATLTGIGDAVIVTDAAGVITLMNPVAQTLTGWNEEATSRPVEEVFRIVNEQTRQPVESPVSRVIREGAVAGLANHTILIAKDGTEWPIDDSAAPIRDQHGHIVGVVMVFREITVRRRIEIERSRAENLLRESESSLRQATAALQAKEAELGLVISQTPLLLTRCSRDGRYLFVNRAYAEFLGRPADEIVGRPIVEVMGEAAFATINSQVERVLRGETAEFEVEVPYAAIGRRFMRALYTPDRNEHGEVIGWIATLMDITDRKQFEREREERAAELALALAKRTQEARRAENAERLLREADRLKDEFLATLAHELRNPLAPLSNALELLRRADGDAALRRRARDMMVRQVGQLVRLVDDLLDISRVTSGRLELRKQRTNLAEVLKTAIETSRPIIEASGHQFSVTLPPQPVQLLADPIRLAQVFSNLLNNAAKYTDTAGHIWLTAARQNGEAVVSVRDTGIGISAEHLPSIFKMFSQAHPALERSQGGLGIGLALVQGLVQLHGGTVEAQSEGVGKGSEFTVRLPLAEEANTAAEQSPHAKDPAALPPVHPVKILVVDDNRDAAESLTLMLRFLGHDIRTAYDGLEAVETAAAFRPDVALLDIGLPKLNGYDAARRIREQPWGKNMALIALTGWGQDEDKRLAAEAGFDRHLVKPAELAELQAILASVKPGG